MADEPFGVAQRTPEEGEHLDRGQDADEGGQAGLQCGTADHVARPGQEADGGCRRGEAEQPRQGQAPIGRARLGQHAPERAAPGSRRDRQREAGGRRQRHHGVEVGEEERLVRGHHDRASVEPGLNRRGQARHGRRVERRRGLVEQQDAGPGAAGRRARATRWRSPELSVRPSWPTAVRSPAGRLARRSASPTAAEHPAEVVVRRIGGTQPEVVGRVALKRCGRCGSHEK